MTLSLIAFSWAWPQEQPIDPSLDPQQVSWQEAKLSIKMYVCLNEVAIFPQQVDDTALLAQLSPLFARDAETIEKQGIAWILRSSERSSREALNDKIATLRRQSGVKYAGPVMYENAHKHAFSMRVPNGQLIVRYLDNLSESQIADIETSLTLSRLQRLKFVNGCIYQASDTWEAIRLAKALAALTQVVYAYPDCWRKAHTKSRATPDDPIFAQQWHLKNTGQGGGTPNEDVALGQIESVWDTYKGENMVIAIVDDGLEIAHEDLQANVIPGKSWDYVDNDTDPTRNEHGTCCAGCAAARGFNNLGVCGSAPYAGLIGHAILEADTDANEADALYTRNLDIIHVSSNSWGPWDYNPDPGYNFTHLEAAGPLAHDAIAAGVIDGRNGKGVVYMWACGNGEIENSNSDGYNNSRHVIAVAACDFKGIRAYYSEKGANVLIASPSQGNGPDPAIVTVDRTGTAGYNTAPAPAGNYAYDFNGTSAATPIAAGCVALVLQANPNLTWRDVQHILVRTAYQNDPGDSDWAVNGAGLHINHKYGFGRINVAAAIELAKTWNNVPGETMTSGSATPNLAIPDNDPTGVESTIAVTQGMTVEHVDVIFSAADHVHWTDLQIELFSPAGTRSVLAERLTIDHKPGTPLYEGWRFMSVRHWGENAAGTWKLVVKDLTAGNGGTLQAWTINIYGTYAKRDAGTNNGSGGGCGATGIEFLLFVLLCAIGRICSKRTRHA